MIVIDAGGIKSMRGISSYIHSIIGGFGDIQERPILSTNIIILTPLGAKWDDKKIIENSNVKFIYRPYFNQVIWELFLVPIYSKILGANLIHYTGNTGGVLFPKILRINTIVTIHDVSFLKKSLSLNKKSSIRQKIGAFYRSFNVPKIAHSSTKIITVSEFAKTDIMKEVNCEKNKIYVINNSLPQAFFKEKKTTVKENIILLISGEGKQKNLDFTLNCLSINQKIFKNWKVFVIGVEGRESSNFIKFLGRIQPNKLVYYYDKASIFLMPSLYESFSIPIIEALSRNTLVVASNRGAVSEILKNYGNLYNPDSCSDLISNINTAIKNVENKTIDTLDSEIYAKSFLRINQSKATLELYKNAVNAL